MSEKAPECCWLAGEGHSTKRRPPSLDRSIFVCSNLALVFDPKAWTMVQSSRRF